MKKGRLVSMRDKLTWLKKSMAINQAPAPDMDEEIDNKRKRLLLVVPALAGSGLILLATHWYGSGLSPDSVGYIGTARNIASGAGVVSYDGLPLVVQPPLYPLLLAIANVFLGIDPLTAAPFINACLFGIIIYLSGLLFFDYLKPSVLLVFLGTCSLLVLAVLVEVSLMAWSELLFICFILLYLVNFRSYQDEGEVRSVVLLSISVAFACMTRYIGAVLIPVGAVSILLFSNIDMKKRIRHISLFLLISIPPLGIWAVRNYLATGTATGSRTSSVFTFSQNLTLAMNTFLKWFVPETVAGNETIMVMTGMAAGFLAGAAVWANRSKIRTTLLDIGPVLLLVAGYTGFLVGYSSIIGFDVIGNRLLSPVAVPVLLLLLFLAGRVSALLGRGFSQRLVDFSLAIVISIFMVYPATATISLVEKHIREGGWGYNGKYWKDSATVQYLIDHPGLDSGCTYYTNGPDVAYILAGLHARMAPLRSNVNSPDALNDLSQLRGSWPEEDRACLVWFDKIKGDYLFTVEDLRRAADIRQTVWLDDGGIYTLERAGDNRGRT